MTKYEKRAWAVGVGTLMIVIPLLVLLQFFVDNILVRWYLLTGLLLGGFLTCALWSDLGDQWSAVAWAIPHIIMAYIFYWTAMLAFAFFAAATFGVGADSTAMALIYTTFVLLGVRFILLAYSLRKERLTNTESPKTGDTISDSLSNI